MFGGTKIGSVLKVDASCMAGIAFSNCALGLTHSAAHAFGAEFGISHGLANAVILPYNLKFNASDSKTQTVIRNWPILLGRLPC